MTGYNPPVVSAREVCAALHPDGELGRGGGRVHTGKQREADGGWTLREDVDTFCEGFSMVSYYLLQVMWRNWARRGHTAHRPTKIFFIKATFKVFSLFLSSQLRSL